MASRRRRCMLSCAVCGALVLLWALPAGACSIPVFRYALERWQPDPYRLAIFHRGPLPAGDKAVVDWLMKHTSDYDSPCNLAVRTVDLAAKAEAESEAKAEEGLRKLWKSQTGAKLPWMVVLYPWGSGIEQSAWSGPFDAANVKGLVDSPARREIAKRIIKGESAVWVLLASGDQEKDDAAAKTLTDELQHCEKTLELPKQDDSWGSYEEEDEPAGPELRVAFSLLRVPRKDPAERVFMKMLRRTEPDLETDYASEPIVFAVFGRGRALFSLAAKGIEKRNIQEACLFVTGPCSCQVKRMNPGLDLLMTVAWEELLGESYGKTPELPPLTGLLGASGPALAAAGGGDSKPLEMKPFTVEVAPQAGAAQKPQGSSQGAFAVGRTELLILGGAGMLLLVSAVVTVVVLNRRNLSRS